MRALEFTTELGDSPSLTIPDEVAAQLPKMGKVRVIVLTEETDRDPAWQEGSYAQFLRDDAPEDAIYDRLR